jgi:acetylornithine aminotransferase
VIETIEKDGLLEHAAEVGAALSAAVADPRVTEVRGEGLLVGLDLDAKVAPQVVAAAQEAGFIINACAPDRIRLAPPLVLEHSQVEELASAWPKILDAGYAQGERQ